MSAIRSYDTSVRAGWSEFAPERSSQRASSCGVLRATYVRPDSAAKTRHGANRRRRPRDFSVAARSAHGCKFVRDRHRHAIRVPRGATRSSQAAPHEDDREPCRRPRRVTVSATGSFRPATSSPAVGMATNLPRCAGETGAGRTRRTPPRLTVRVRGRTIGHSHRPASSRHEPPLVTAMADHASAVPALRPRARRSMAAVKERCRLAEQHVRGGAAPRRRSWTSRCARPWFSPRAGGRRRAPAGSAGCAPAPPSPCRTPAAR